MIARLLQMFAPFIQLLTLCVSLVVWDFVFPCLISQQLRNVVQVVLDVHEAVSRALASSTLPWLGGPSFHPEAFSPVMCALVAAAALRWHAASSVAELVKSRLPAFAQSTPLDALHSSLARYFEAFAADAPPPAALC